MIMIEMMIKRGIFECVHGWGQNWSALKQKTNLAVSVFLGSGKERRWDELNPTYDAAVLIQTSSKFVSKRREAEN